MTLKNFKTEFTKTKEEVLQNYRILLNYTNININELMLFLGSKKNCYKKVYSVTNFPKDLIILKHLLDHSSENSKYNLIGMAIYLPLEFYEYGIQKNIMLNGSNFNIFAYYTIVDVLFHKNNEGKSDHFTHFQKIYPSLNTETKYFILNRLVNNHPILFVKQYLSLLNINFEFKKEFMNTYLNEDECDRFVNEKELYNSLF